MSKEMYTDGKTVDVVDVTADGVVEVSAGAGYSNPGEVHCQLRETGNGFVAFFPARNSVQQDYYLCMNYGQARDLVLALSRFKKALGFEEADHTEDVLAMATPADELTVAYMCGLHRGKEAKGVLTKEQWVDVLDVLEDSRDDVLELLVDAKLNTRHQHNDKRIVAYQTQLAKHDKVIELVKSVLGGAS